MDAKIEMKKINVMEVAFAARTIFSSQTFIMRREGRETCSAFLNILRDKYKVSRRGAESDFIVFPLSLDEVHNQ